MNAKEFIDILKKDKGKVYSLEKLMFIFSNGDSVLYNSIRTDKYDYFYDVMCECMRLGFLIEKKSAKYNSNPFKPLKLSFDKYQEKKYELKNADKAFLHSLNSKIDTSYYIKNPCELTKDKEHLSSLSNFLNNSSLYDEISIRERSYQLFNDEKFIQKTSILSNIKVTYKDIKVIENPQPLLCFMKKSFYKKRKKNILIIENLDTFWSLQRFIFLENNLKKIDMLVFGGGYKITNSNYDFSYYNISTKDRIYYFGDLDSEGIYIYQLFKSKFSEYNIKLLVCFYKYLMDELKLNKLVFFPTQRNADVESLFKNESSYIPDDMLYCFKDVITRKLFIPQEALNLDVLRRNKDLWKI